MRFGSNRRRDQRGGAAVEFALILPLFIILLSAILDYGYYFYIQNYLTNSVRNGVRMGVTKRGANLADQQAQMHNLACEHAKDAMLLSFGLECTDSTTGLDLCPCTASHSTGIFGSEQWYMYQLTITRAFDAPMGMVPAPRYNAYSYTMRYEY